MERLQPIINYAVELSVDDSLDIHMGDVIQYIINYITNYYITQGISYTAGNGINILGNVIAVRDGKGLDASGGDLDVELDTDPGLEFDEDTADGKLRAKCNTAAAVDKDSSGIKVLLSDSVETGSGGGGGGLSFDGTDGVRVDPEDFLYLGS